MQKPWNYTKFSGVLNHAMMHITLLHTFIGVVGYLKWGCDSGGNFVRNHPVNDLYKFFHIFYSFKRDTPLVYF